MGSRSGKRAISGRTDVGAVSLKPVDLERRVFVRDNADADPVALEIRSAREGLAVRARVISDPIERIAALDERERLAAYRFRGDFVTAGLGPHFAKSVFLRLDKGLGMPGSERETLAREHIRKAALALGRIQFSICWDVCGCCFPTKHWAAKQSDLGREVSEKHAIGILIAALDRLATFYQEVK